MLSRRVLLGAAAGMAVAPAARAATTARDDLAPVFAEHGVTGCFVVRDAATGALTTVNAARCAKRFSPASTFKIPNALIALDLGTVKDEHEVFAWDGKPYWLKTWERDMDLAEAMRVSNLPVFQQIARRAGPERMQAALTRLAYGSMKIGPKVDDFWVTGALTISAIEQVEFLSRLARKELPVSVRAQEIVARITRLEESGGRVLHGKTGWFARSKPGIGWLVGWVEGPDGAKAFALNVDMPGIETAPKRLVVAKALLARLGLYGA